MQILRFLTLICSLSIPLRLGAQPIPSVDTTGGWLLYAPHTILLPNSSLKVQRLFIGGLDTVMTPFGPTLSKGRNDYTTFVPITPGVADSGYVCINHESIVPDSMIGDGGGMTILKVVRDADSLRMVGMPRAVDFRPVGGTLGNCAGITGPDGQVWTGEEPWRSNNSTLFSADTNDVTLAPLGQGPGPGQVFNDIPGDFSGRTIKAYQNFNYMVKIDPANAVAVRKQYNWGRMQHEGGAILNDNRTVLLSPDAAPGYFVRFVADSAGDFSRGHTYAYRQMPGTAGEWLEIDNTSLDSTIRFQNIAAREGCSMFSRLEWSGVYSGKVYFTETGIDLPQAAFRGAHTYGANVAQHHIERAKIQNPAFAGMPDAQVADSIYYGTWQYTDYYGRILEYDPFTHEIRVFLEGGPNYVSGDPYPLNHFSNPDAMAFLRVNGRAFMLIAEDLIGTSRGRIHPNANAGYCEVYMLDMAIPNPQVEDLVRIAVMPIGAEATGTASTPDGKTVFFASQHPLFSNPFPHNYSITYAVSGWDQVISDIEEKAKNEPISFYPNPADRTLFLGQTLSGDLYNNSGILVRRIDRSRHIDVLNLPNGLYIFRANDGRNARVMVLH